MVNPLVLETLPEKEIKLICNQLVAFNPTIQDAQIDYPRSKNASTSVIVAVMR
jgi:hypothetical protein